MDKVKMMAVFACLSSVLAVTSARHMVKHSGHHHPEDWKEVGSPSDLSRIHANVTGMDAKDRGILEMMDMCNGTFPTPIDYLVQLNETGQFPEAANRDSKCFLNCIFTRLKLFDEKGEIDKSLVGKMFADKEEDAMKIAAFGDCLEEKERAEDVCEQTYERISCFMKGALDYYADGKNRKSEKM